MKAEVSEDAMQKTINEYLEWNKIDFIRIPDKLFGWIAVNTPKLIPKWFKIWFFGLFSGRPDNTIIIPIGNGLAVALLLELKTQDSKGRAVGSLHGRQKHHIDDWVVCRSVDDAIREINRVVRIAEKIKTIVHDDMY